MSHGPVLFTPEGRLIRKDETLNRSEPRHVTKHLRQWFVTFAAFLHKHALELHCGLCHVALPQAAHAWRHWGECPGKQPIAESGAGLQVEKTATGLVGVSGDESTATPFARIELAPNAIEWFRQAQDVCRHFLLGIHCTRCRADLVGLNSDEDQVFSTACACREWIGNNREQRKPVVETIH